MASTLMNSLEAEGKLYQIEVVRDVVGKRGKGQYGTEHDEWKDDDKIETLLPPNEGNLH